MKRLIYFLLLLSAIHAIGCGQDQSPQIKPWYLHYQGGPWHYIKGPYSTEAECTSWYMTNLPANSTGYCVQDSNCEVAVCH